jgi:O-antigen ligase
MGLLKVIFILFIILFPIAEVGRIQFANGVAVSVNDIFLSVLIIVWLGFHLYKKKRFDKSYLVKPLSLFSLVALISLALNFLNLKLDAWLISFSYLLRWVAYASLYFIVKEFDTKFKFKTSYVLLVSGFFVVLIGFVQYFLYPNLRNLYYLGWDEHLYRLFSSFLDPNFAGAFFAIYFLFAIIFTSGFLKKRNWVRFLTVGVVALLALCALYLTYSRSALIMLAVSVVVYLYLINKKKFILLILLLVFSLIFILPKSFQTEGTNFLRAASSEARVQTAKEALTIIQKNPLYGVGFNAYRYARNLQGLNGPNWEVSHGAAGTDNSFLFVLATTGIVGLVAFLWLIYKMFRLGITNLKKSNFSIVLFSVIVGLIFNSLFVNSFFYVLILEWIWILSGLTEKS